MNENLNMLKFSAVSQYRNFTYDKLEVSDLSHNIGDIVLIISDKYGKGFSNKYAAIRGYYSMSDHDGYVVTILNSIYETYGEYVCDYAVDEDMITSVDFYDA